MKTITTINDKNLRKLYNTGQLSRKDFSNILGYESEWINNTINMGFTKKKSTFYFIKKIQTKIYLTLIKKYINPTRKLKILDFGGGIGRFIPFFINKDCHYDFVESCKTNIDFAFRNTNKNSKINFYWQTLESFKSNIKYDLILAPEIICYHKAPVLLIKQLRNLLTPTGIIFFSVENISCSELFYQAKLKTLSNSKSFPYLLYEKNNYYVRPTTHKLFISCLKTNKLTILKSNYIFNKLEGKNYNQLNINQLNDYDYYKKIISEESNITKQTASHNCRAIYAIVKLQEK